MLHRFWGFRPRSRGKNGGAGVDVISVYGRDAGLFAWSDSGSNPEPIREGEEAMTEARPWPNAAIEMRNQAAERAARAAHELEKLIEMTKDPAEKAQALLVLMEITQTSRWLELAGAQTRPKVF